MPLLLACAGPAPAPPSDVLVLVSDALRADVLSCYGGGARTPHLCGLAERGVLFERAYASAPWTLPSTIALFTGQYPLRHGSEGRRSESTQSLFYYVRSDERLLAEELTERGWRTVARTENPIALHSNALQGIEATRIAAEPEPEAGLRSATAADASVGRHRHVRWLAEELVAAPRDAHHLWLHWMLDPHAPYRPPPFADEAVGLPREAAEYRRFSHADKDEQLDLRRVAPQLEPAEIAHLADLYRREVEDVDRRIGVVLAALERSGRADTTLVIFTSDHGEEFGEHGGVLHDHALWEPVVRVPLLVAGPGVRRGVRLHEPVSHVDLMPTLAELLDVAGLGPFDGESLATSLATGREPRRRFHYLAGNMARDREAGVHGRYKLLAGPHGVELYDVVADPQERRDLAAVRPEIVRRLLATLEATRWNVERAALERVGASGSKELDAAREELERSLRALGYLQ